MVDVEAYSSDGEDFNEFTCGSCGFIYDNEEEAEACCESLEVKEDYEKTRFDDVPDFDDEHGWARQKAEEIEMDKREADGK